MASTNLARLPASAGSTTTGTFSFWIKGNLATGSNQNLYSVSDGGNAYQMWINVNGQLDFHAWNGASYPARLHPSANLRDTNGWYHIVFTIDTNNATAGDRLRLYINGERYTGAWLAETYPSQGAGIIFAKNSTTRIGSEWDNTDYFGGLMSHFHMIDGTAYDATAFGQYDANGVWTIKTSPSVTYGTNGFFILKDGNSVTDQSGNTNNFTVAGGTLTKTEDNPSNVFATLNALDKPGTGNLPGFANGNTTYNKTLTGAGNNSQSNATLAASTGKWYFELKQNDANAIVVGIDYADNTGYDSNGASLARSGGGICYANDGQKNIDGTYSSYGNSWTTNDIIGVAFDLDNNFIYFSKNGTWQNSGDPTSGATGTGGITISTTGVLYRPGVMNNGYNSTSNASLNFGNGYFGTTAVASAGTNASGIGIFEYDVPTGYTALSTKGLNL